MYYKLKDKLYHLYRHHILKDDIRVKIGKVELQHLERYKLAKELCSANTRILDAACGYGYGSYILKNRCSYLGIDKSEKCIRYARQHFEGNFVYDNLEYCNLSEKFDFIISFETLEHLTHPEHLLKEFSKSLSPIGYGKLLISIPINHLDRIYHKKIYKLSDVKLLFKDWNLIQEWYQNDIEIEEGARKGISFKDSYWIYIALFKPNKGIKNEI